MVATDGIELPTPAFSGLDSPTAIGFILKDKALVSVPKTPLLLGQ